MILKRVGNGLRILHCSVLYLWYENLENDELWDSSYKCTFKSERVSILRDTGCPNWHW